MNATPQISHGSRRRRRGIALVTVVSILALATVLLLALFTNSRTEMRSTIVYGDGVSARMQADNAVNIVIGRIKDAAMQDETVDGVEIWASQPGMARQYRQDGTLLRGNKLFSDHDMTADTEAEVIADVPPSNWDSMPDRYVDMNEPVARYKDDNGVAGTRWIFPIIDPRAYTTDPKRSVEGFSYTQNADGASGPSLNGVVLPGSGEDSQRLPMPVEWMYVLRDGTLGYLDDSNRFVGGGGERASRANPIVSRVAFWTDDESCKININTAGEATYWDTPRLYHKVDGEWARYQPMVYEYQRYPGHPATVCMSSVLFPNQEMNPPVDGPDFPDALKRKEAIYDLMPKILPGGSKAGSVLVPSGRNFTPRDFAQVQTAIAERLFPSVDEFLLRPKVDVGGERKEIDLGDNGLWQGLERPEVVSRLRAFLTPNSRSPETNPFGLPKISMWPLHRINSPEYRTVFDQTIAYCSRFAGRDYSFTRQDSTSQTEILGILRNRQLFDYLMKLTDSPIPGFGAASASFAKKFGDNREQILVEIFDYIRSTNLYDDNLAEKNVGDTPTIPGLPKSRLISYTTSGGMAAKTFTPMRNTSSNSSYAGHGQVMPSVIPKGKNEVYRGMGRFMTISEAGLHFICCAEGTQKAGGPPAPKITPSNPPAAAGYTAPSWKGGAWGNSSFWYSNFPPLTGSNQNPATGFYISKYPSQHTLEGVPGNDPNYPGYNPLNWNWTLEPNKPLPPNTKRVQATLILEWFCPSVGWSLINPDLQLEVDAGTVSVGGQKMFPKNGGKVIIKPFQHMASGWGIYARGGTTPYRAFLQGRRLPAEKAGTDGYAKGSMPEDSGYNNYQSQPGILQNAIRYDLVSDFFDVPANGAIPFSGGLITVKILPTNKTNPPPLQIFNFNFPGQNFPTPILATKSEDTTWGQNFNGSWWVKHPVPAPYWWSYNIDGALGRDQSGKFTSTAKSAELGGRFRYVGNEIGEYGDIPNEGHYYRGNLVIPDDTLQSLVLRHGDPRLTMGQYEVPDEEFIQHRYYGKQRLAHNIVLARWSDGPGLDKGEDKKGWRLVKNANYHQNFLPDHPYAPATGVGLQKYADFDRGISNQTDGAYVNKPDEGNAYGAVSATTGEQAVPYFTDPWVTWVAGSSYFSPNRQVASPGMLGSLPTGVHQSSTGSGAGAKREPWRTLLFRPQTWSVKQGQQFHVGAPKVLKGYGKSGLPIQGIDPPDYLFMDFFWMPVVEPYAMSAPGSTAGKINMNYRMVPFGHIRRATGLYAALKSEVLSAVALDDANIYLRRPGSAPAGQAQTWFWTDEGGGKNANKFWHRRADTDATFKLFDERFGTGFAFISPAQICDMHLLPKRVSGSDNMVPSKWAETLKDLLKAGSANSILTFWEKHAVTGENLKERPYTNLYPRLTTRSNTFQVHVRAQTVRKARSADPEVFDSTKDLVSAEYRGSSVIERYLDLNNPALRASGGVDFANGNPLSRPSLDAYHRFRVVRQHRFDQ